MAAMIIAKIDFSDQSDHHMKPGLAVYSVITKSYVLYYNGN